MSRVLRRPMFRGGYVDSEGTGITSGLDTPKRGLVDGPGGYAGELSFGEKFRMAMEEANANQQAKYDALKSNKSYNLDINLGSIYDALNPPTSEILKRLQERQKEEPLMTRLNRFLTQPVSAADLTYGSEAEKQAAIAAEEEAKKAKLTPPPSSTPSTSPLEKEEVSKRQDFKTIYEDLLPIFKASVGPDQDEYTRQKYLELAKFGLNLLKPTPAGIKPSLLGSVAAAAEKPLEGYGAILERERQAAKVPEALALQQAMKLSEPGAVGKAIRDLINSGVAKNEKEALNIYLKGDSASQKKIALEEKQLIRADLQGYEGLKGIKDQAIINQLADLVYKDPDLAYKIKGDRSKYKPEALEEGAIYIDKGKIVKYKGGQFYRVNEPGFKG